MRACKVCSAPATALHPWAAEYLNRLGLTPAPASTARAHSSRNAHHNAREEAPSEPPPRPQEYRDARRSIVAALGVQPHSFAGIVARANGAVAADATSDVYDLRGVRSVAYNHDTSDVTTQTAQESSTAPSTPAQHAAPDSSSTTSSPVSTSTPTAKQPLLYWPPVPQIVASIKHMLYRKRYVFAAMQRLAHDAQATGNQGTADTSAARFFPVHSLPQHIAAVPHTLLHTVAEHSIRHSWHGAPSVYPGGSAPAASTPFVPDAVAALTVADVAGPHWDRAVAARCLVQVLQEPGVEQALRQALWAAAQDYHKAILHKLDSLAVVEPRSGDAVVVVPSIRGSLPSARLPVQALKEDLFSFQEVLFFTRVPQRVDDRVRREPVECPPLEGSHLFLFTTANVAVAEALSQRPPSDIFTPVVFTSSEQAHPSRRTQPPPATLSVRDKLWIMLSEMVRLRYLVAYMLLLERTLHSIRGTAAVLTGNSQQASAAMHAEFEVASAQVARDAKCIKLVVRFLRSPLHQWLGLTTHRHRFLRKVQVRQTASSAAVTTCGTEDAAGPRYATVQELYTAFSRALKGSAEVTERNATSDATAPVDAVRKTKAPEVAQAGAAPAQTPQHVAAPVHVDAASAESSHLSHADTRLLAAILSRAPRANTKPVATRNANAGEDEQPTAPETQCPPEQQSQSTSREADATGRASKTECGALDASCTNCTASDPVITLRFFRKKMEAVWPFELLCDRERTSRFRMRVRDTHKDCFHAERASEDARGAEEQKRGENRPTPLSRSALNEALRAFPFVVQVNGAAVTSTEELEHLVRTARRLRISLCAKPPR